MYVLKVKRSSSRPTVRPNIQDCLWERIGANHQKNPDFKFKLTYSSEFPEKKIQLG